MIMTIACIKRFETWSVTRNVHGSRRRDPQSSHPHLNMGDWFAVSK